MDNKLEHPWTELQLLIKKKWLTQKAFSSILWKKVSEVNELLKWKRNITIQRDYLLHQTLWTPIKYWILKQIDYDYSLLDIEETNEILTVPSPNRRGLGWGSEDQGEVSSHQTNHSEHHASHSEQSEESRTTDLNPLDSSIPLRSSLNNNTTQNETKPQKTPAKEPDSKDDEDLQNRAKIFRTF